MPDFDEILNKKITELENGASLESVLRDLPEEARDLTPLIRLAAAVRSLPQPEPEASQVTLQRQQVMAAAIRNTQPVRQRQPRQPLPVLRWGQLSAGAALSLAGALVVLLAVVVFGASAWFSARTMNSAVVESVSGQAQVATNAAGTAWKNIAAGDRLRQGDQLRTLGASTATLAFYEGSRTLVAPNSDLTFKELRGGSGKTIQVRLEQAGGETWNTVTPFGGNPKSYFLVETPSGTASVHGTIFDVMVSQTGLARFAVTSGVVRVQADGSEVTLNAGQTTSANPTGQINPPAYQFSIQGSLTNIDNTSQTWTVSGLSFKVTSATVISGEPHLGNTLIVSGHIQADQVHVADAITLSGSDDEAAFFTGVLENNTGPVWQVSGTPVSVTGETELPQALTPGDPVKVSFNLLEDGTFLATRIDSLAERSATPAPILTATGAPRAKPEFVFAPEMVEANGCGAREYNLAGALRNTASNPKDYGADVRLGFLIDRGGEYADTVVITPASFGRIDPGQTLPFTIRVTTTASWSTAPDGAEIRLRLFIAAPTGRPNQHNGQMTVSITARCPEATATVATPPATASMETPEAAETAAPTPAATVSQPAGQCPPDNPQPTGMRLAQRYGVPYATIMSWFCQHYGFGEIDLAYSLSNQTGKPVEAIFAMRASGLGWGEIKQQLQPAPGVKPNQENKGQENNPGNNGNGGGKGNGGNGGKGNP